LKIEIHCPGCRKGYLVDESAAGAEFICPACAVPVALRVPDRRTAPPSTGSAPGAGGGRGAASSGGPRPAAGAPRAATATNAATAAAPAVSPDVAAEPDEVVCPRCNLHFSPRKVGVAPRRGERPHVLIVDEAGFFLNMARDALTRDFEVSTATSAAEASSILAGGGVDVLVLDPGLENEEGGRWLLRGDTIKLCPVLIYSTDESLIYGERWEELRALGADDIVIKGMNVAETLGRKVGALLGRSWDEDDEP